MKRNVRLVLTPLQCKFSLGPPPETEYAYCVRLLERSGTNFINAISPRHPLQKRIMHLATNPSNTLCIPPQTPGTQYTHRHYLQVKPENVPRKEVCYPPSSQVTQSSPDTIPSNAACDQLPPTQ
ncbi:hypothetical protein DPMN_029596 [Dreissena polymorpha]|uniref:Uncharacterized protein n=1 Tax=Dreissena polymorpha TaxID=45954 RepID=A0A9D4RFF0_DREPO|nr:hypothetical protein DPMN_029596 [Dreissena polymorpha]